MRSRAPLLSARHATASRRLSPRASSPRSQRGFTLIEVLIALIVLVLGVLGAAGMTLASMRDSKQSGLRAQASGLAYELADIMRANPGQETVFTSAQAVANSSCWSATGCAPGDMAKNDYYEWTQRLASVGGLPNASVVVCHDASTLNQLGCDNAAAAPLVIKLQWDEKNNQSRDQAASNATAVTRRLLAVVVRSCVYGPPACT